MRVYLDDCGRNRKKPNVRTMDSMSSAKILEEGISCLFERLGTVETERFISTLMREKFDYTKWKRKYFDDVNADDFNAAAVEYANSRPFRPNQTLIPIE